VPTRNDKYLGRKYRTEAIAVPYKLVLSVIIHLDSMLLLHPDVHSLPSPSDFVIKLLSSLIFKIYLIIFY
jgi:hypothetical protein